MLIRFLVLLISILPVPGGTYFEIQAVDAETGRGIPCVEFETVHHVRYFTDSAGRIAYAEPEHEGRTVFFSIRSDGYQSPKDGFGLAGARLKVSSGHKEVIRLRRTSIAERLYRLTGEGIYRDSVLLGYKVPLSTPILNAEVAGQDSIQRVIFGGKARWFWGDTTRLSYPLGNFRMSGAVSDLPNQGGLNPDAGVQYRYFTNADGFARGMFPLKPDGDLIWAGGFLVLTNSAGEERMLAQFLRLKALDKPINQGLAIYDKQKDAFELLQMIDLSEKWRLPHGHPVRVGDYFLFGGPFPNVRVRTDFASITNREAYEAWSCLPEGIEGKSKETVPYRWTKLAPPIGVKEEKELIEAGVLRREDAFYQPVDIGSGKVVAMHSGTVARNEWRKKWILIAVEIGGSSMLGEVWYSESDEPTGPWRRARRIVTHEKYSFYNPAHHPFFDEAGGRIIYFEGTYTADFSGNSKHTPRYDYNNLMYRLDLDRAKLE